MWKGWPRWQEWVVSGLVDLWLTMRGLWVGCEIVSGLYQDWIVQKIGKFFKISIKMLINIEMLPINPWTDYWWRLLYRPSPITKISWHFKPCLEFTNERGSKLFIQAFNIEIKLILIPLCYCLNIRPIDIYSGTKRF